MSALVNFIKKYWPSIVPVAVTIWTLYGTQVKAFIAHSPALAIVIATLYSIIAHLMPSPVSPSAPPVQK